MRSVKIALAVAMALFVAALGVVLSRSPPIAVGANDVHAPQFPDGGIPGGSSGCQAAGTIPRGTSAIRVSLGANVNPRIDVELFDGTQRISRGKLGAGGGLNASATVPLTRVARTVRAGIVCLTLGRSAEVVGVRGIPTREPVDGLYSLQDMRLRFEYLRPGPRSWWSMASSIAYRFGLGRAAPGTWIVFLALALMLAVAILASSLALKELR
jgi:hypothetical protein